MINDCVLIICYYVFTIYLLICISWILVIYDLLAVRVSCLHNVECGVLVQIELMHTTYACLHTCLEKARARIPQL